MELELGLTLSTNLAQAQGCDKLNKRKRIFGHDYESISDVNFNVKLPKTLPLLTWNDKEQKEIQNSTVTKRNVVEEDDTVVGWPPIKSWRKKLYQKNLRRCAFNYVTVENGGAGVGGGGGGSNSMYVKVKMEGVGIGRKVDLSLHNSYQTLISNLIAMFGKCQVNIEMYKLTYQDKEGDWLLAGDVPWGNFIQSVQRLKLLRRGN
ncbi:hypothetical protein ACJIZ3_021120 [Penstemon smallii]|uniref:Auxin-responsive protein n=1 Tax=Penstemon smallii TaxID=265156 RepID=A0ABD3SL35_9LAMI